MTNALQERFSGLMDRLGVADREWSGGVGAGVSGGADSTALAVLLAEWAAARGIPFLAITCDHGLRPEAAAETDAVAAMMRGIGARCRVLRLGLSKGTAIQERARDARYGAMLDAIRREGIGILAVGHHRMDQAETVEHRLRSGGGGPSSLAGMLPVRAAEDAILVRPLLPCWPADMRTFLLDAGIPWVEDPSNRDSRYARARIRESLAADPVRVAFLLRTAAENGERLAAIRSAAAERLAKAGAKLHAGGAVSLDPDALGLGPAAAEAFRPILTAATGRVPAVGDRQLLDLLDRGAGSIAGAVLWRQGRRSWVAREASAMAPPAPAADWSMWDGRIRFGYGVPDGLTVGPLGDADATAVRKLHGCGLPHRVLAAVPCLRRNGVLAAVPDLGLGEAVSTRPVRRLPAGLAVDMPMLSPTVWNGEPCGHGTPRLSV